MINSVSLLPWLPGGSESNSSLNHTNCASPYNLHTCVTLYVSLRLFWLLGTQASKEERIYCKEMGSGGHWNHAATSVSLLQAQGLSPVISVFFCYLFSTNQSHPTTQLLFPHNWSLHVAITAPLAPLYVTFQLYLHPLACSLSTSRFKFKSGIWPA